jgi:hypothetical protein
MAYRRHRVWSSLSPDINGSEYLLLYFSLFEQFTVLVFVMRLVTYVILGTLNGQLCESEVERKGMKNDDRKNNGRISGRMALQKKEKENCALSYLTTPSVRRLRIVSNDEMEIVWKETLATLSR